jgi:hypothetical protein
LDLGGGGAADPEDQGGGQNEGSANVVHEFLRNGLGNNLFQVIQTFNYSKSPRVSDSTYVLSKFGMIEHFNKALISTFGK